MTGQRQRYGVRVDKLTYSYLDGVTGFKCLVTCLPKTMFRRGMTDQRQEWLDRSKTRERLLEQEQATCGVVLKSLGKSLLESRTK
jgi:hypothetical protein